jgi:hypothetical protein
VISQLFVVRCQLLIELKLSFLVLFNLQLTTNNEELTKVLCLL